MLKIVLGPTPADHKVLDTETGADISNLVPISEIVLHATANGLATAAIHVEVMEAFISGGQVAWVMRHPITGDLARISGIFFADCTLVDFSAGAPPRVVPAAEIDRVIGRAPLPKPTVTPSPNGWKR